MRKIIFTMLALVGLTASAQGIKSGSEWNISNLVYEAKVNIDNTITFTAMVEGEELAFRLTPNYSKKNEFVLSEELNADGFNPFSKTPRAKYIEQEGWKLICLYDLEGNLHDVLDGSFFGEGEAVAMGKWMQQIMGKYPTVMVTRWRSVMKSSMRKALPVPNLRMLPSTVLSQAYSASADSPTLKECGRLCRRSMV